MSSRRALSCSASFLGSNFPEASVRRGSLLSDSSTSTVEESEIARVEGRVEDSEIARVGGSVITCSFPSGNSVASIVESVSSRVERCVAVGEVARLGGGV